ncbi:pul domain-containing protein [Ophiostoma piceae UAMH 11346]|uniref:Pul domain-containing protein n=1 Tax=Ophiostoma piceae (strain UAMH 11346) TaxID=1262450 RepID=S3CUG1_OPHP1|nr:pul domain-containing protein [Ophiostoma piceae UAMH 11346]
MDVTLLVYDLSQGLARQMSMGFLGFQLDAIYHTSIEVNGREYVYDGGIVAIVPGSSHLGQPLERIPLGTTALRMDVIEEYLESVRPLFTAEAYDLFHHNCNNFSDTFSNFLVGTGIPRHISSMPQAVLESPMGRMLVPQLMQSVNSGRQQNGGSLLGLGQSAQSAPGLSTSSLPATTSPGSTGAVKNVSTPAELSRLLDAAKTSCAAIFFTSATCPPCKILYPVYDQLAQELQGKITLIKVDISLPQAQPIAMQYSVHATPTFITFLKGEKESQWSGADSAKLRGNLQLLTTIAQGRLHLHEKLRLPSFAQPAGAPAPKPVLYPKVPPLEKLIAKMGDTASKKPEVQALKAYLDGRSNQNTLGSVAVPPLNDLASLITTSVQTMTPETLFAVVDLFRCSLTDPRISGFFAEEAGHKTASAVVASVTGKAECPYALRLVTLQTACNLFSTPLFAEELPKDSELRSLIVQLVSSSFLDDSHTSVRVAAASLLFNISLAHQAARRGDSKASVLLAEDQVELAASVVEAIGQEETSADALRGMLLALGHLGYCAPLDGDLADLLRALDAPGTILGKKTAFPKEPLIDEVGTELLQHGLRRE